MNTNNSHNYNSKTPAASKTIAFKQLFVKDEVAEILMDKTRIAHKRPEDVISSKNKQNIGTTLSFTQKLFEENKEYFEGKLLQEDFSLLYNLLKRRYKKLKQENIIRTMKFLLDKGIKEYLLIDLAKIVVKSQSFNDLLKSGLGKLFDELTDENSPVEINNTKLLNFNNSLKSNIPKTKDELFMDRFFDEIHISSSFNPEEELKRILSLKNDEKEKALNIFYKKLKEQLDILASFPAKIKSLKMDFSNDKVMYYEYARLIIEQLNDEFKILSVEQRKNAIKSISEYCATRILINEYGDISNYENDPKSILSRILNIPLTKVEGGIYYEQELTAGVFYIENEKDYDYIYSSFFGSEEDAKLSGGFFTSSKIIPISVINGAKFFNISSEVIKDHELMHSENKIIIAEIGLDDYLISAKDEIIAYLKDGERGLSEIKYLLMKKEEEMGLYDYYSSYKENPEHYQELRKYYEKDLEKALNIAKYMKELDIPNYLEILAIMPVRKWDLLKKIYKKDDIKEPEMLRNNMIKIFGELQKIY